MIALLIANNGGNNHVHVPRAIRILRETICASGAQPGSRYYHKPRPGKDPRLQAPAPRFSLAIAAAWSPLLTLTRASSFKL
eukprot:scaffold282356_cov31-Tisochrysis_lutea.AAC.1